jgi:hypothetical protein
MEWLLGAAVGWVGGVVSALVATEYSTWRERRRSTRDLVSVLSAEVSANRTRLESAASRVAAIMEEKDPVRMTGAVFLRSAFQASVGRLGLLPKDAMDAVVRLYAALDSVDHLVEEWRWFETTYPVGEPGRESARPALGQMREYFKEACEAALKVADHVLKELKMVQ